MTIHNDQEFKQALSELSVADQRILAAKFVGSVTHLNPDPVIERALKVVQETPQAKISLANSEFDEVYKSIKSLSVKTYTACGGDADWLAQAAHFVATATKACLTPLEQLGNKNNLAWKCAMQTRMAKNCEMMETDSKTIDNEAQKQYAITNDFLSH